MIQNNILEQFKNVYNIFISDKNILIIGIIAVLTLLILEIFSIFNKKKITKILLAFSYLLIFGTLIYFYHNEILTFLDYLMDNIFIFIFFPNLAVYTLTLVIINILMIRTMFYKSSKIIKTISVLFFVVFNIIFYLIINNVIKNNILVYEPLNVYTNSDLLSMVQISMYIFIIYLIIMLIYKVSTNIIKSIKLPKVVENKDLVVEDNKYNSYIDVVPVKKKKSRKTRKNEKTLVKNNSLANILNDIEALKNNKNDQSQIRKIYEQISLNDNDFTLNDYNSLIKALKEIKNN